MVVDLLILTYKAGHRYRARGQIFADYGNAYNYARGMCAGYDMATGGQSDVRIIRLDSPREYESYLAEHVLDKSHG